MDQLHLFLEALIFASENPVSVIELEDCLKKVFPNELINDEMINAQITMLQEKYSSDQFAFELRKTGGGYQFLTKAPYHESISLLLNLKEKKKLSGAALETLSIIAYKQPITKSEVEQIRGVNSDYSIQRLLEKDLIEIAGKKDGPGHSVMYEVSQTFLDYFGINSTGDLPQPKEVEPTEENTIGENIEAQG
jgi:segregation and condensation protein B